MKKQSAALKKKATPASPSAAKEFELGELLGYQLLRLSNSIGNLADREAEEVAGLTLPEYRVLVVLHSRGPSGVAGLQQVILIDKAWISRTLTGLTAKTLVVSEADPADARRTVFSVTVKGKRAADALIERAIERQERIMRGLTREETKQLMNFLSRIQENINNGEH